MAPSLVTVLMNGFTNGLGVTRVAALAAIVFWAGPVFGQDTTAPGSADAASTGGKRVLGIIPNYRTFPTLANYAPITPKEKFKIAVNDSFDRGTVALAAAFAATGQWSNAEPSYRQGALGYARYFGASYTDLLAGDFLTEAIYPVMLHQDPRYFRRGVGSGWSRLGYAMGQIFWTHTDAGRAQFNFSEIAGNSTAVAISTVYSPEGRDATSAVSKLGVQLGVDMGGNLLKEFWPDMQRKFSRHR